jgi:glyoxylase-like metal-dependent hydrolase (beta-lactamase superfamily II)
LFWFGGKLSVAIQILVDAMRFIITLLPVLLGLLCPAVALEAVRVNEHVWAIVGELGQRSPTNLGNNATFGVIVTGNGIVLVDPGGTAKGAAAIDAVLRRISDRSVVAVINTGGQDHRWLGNSYWKVKGSRLISSRTAVADQKARFDTQWMGLKELAGDAALVGTTPVYAEETFDASLDLVIGGVTLQLTHTGRAHTPGDLFVSLPDHGLVFAGDIIYVDRMLAILPAPVSGTADWLKAFDAIAVLKPQVIVPGHGRPTSLEGAKSATRDYLEFLRSSTKSVLDRNGTMIDAGKIDQKGFAHLIGAGELGGRNAQTVFAEIEFE